MSEAEQTADEHNVKLAAETVNYQVLHVVNGVLTTKYSFWARDDRHANELASGVAGTLCRVVERSQG